MASSGNSCWDSHANSTGNKLHHIHKRFIVNDLEFCNICGTILPIPSHDDYLMCLVCKNNFNVKGSLYFCFISINFCLYL